jgi:hypothetical protein
MECVAEGADALLVLNTTCIEASGKGWSAWAGTDLHFRAQVDGVTVVLYPYRSGYLITGSPSSGGSQLRDAVAPMMDDLCNEFLKTRQELERSKKK